eukprot:gene5451-9264_t
MSLQFNWPISWDKELVNSIKDQVQELIDKADIQIDEFVDKIKLEGFDFGTVEPYLKLEAIEELSDKRVCIVLKIKYDGDASVNASTKVNINQASKPRDSYFFSSYFSKTTTSEEEVIMPLDLKIVNLKVDGRIRFLIEYDLDSITIKHKKPKGKLTIQILNDIIKSVEVHSNFDTGKNINLFLMH